MVEDDSCRVGTAHHLKCRPAKGIRWWAVPTLQEKNHQPHQITHMSQRFYGLGREEIPGFAATGRVTSGHFRHCDEIFDSSSKFARLDDRRRRRFAAARGRRLVSQARSRHAKHVGDGLSVAVVSGRFPCDFRPSGRR